MQTASLPEDMIENEVARIHAGPCPLCRGPGPVDIFKSHWVRSFVVVTQWGSHVSISCRPCRNKQWLADTATTVGIGWLGMFGMIVMPIQLVRNAWEFYGGPRPQAPSKRLHALVRNQLQQSGYLAATGNCSRCGAGLSGWVRAWSGSEKLCPSCASDVPRQMAG
jgi:hypothetical protein